MGTSQVSQPGYSWKNGHYPGSDDDDDEFWCVFSKFEVEITPFSIYYKGMVFLQCEFSYMFSNVQVQKNPFGIDCN